MDADENGLRKSELPRKGNNASYPLQVHKTCHLGNKSENSLGFVCNRLPDREIKRKGAKKQRCKGEKLFNHGLHA